MKLKNITRQKIKPWYYIDVTRKKHQTQIKKVRIETMTFNEKRELILLAEKNIKSGKNVSEVESEDVKKMMKKIAANAVSIGLYNFNSFVISNINEGDFTTIKPGWKDARVGMVKCLAIINNEGEDLIDILGLEEIENAVRFTLFELEGEEHEG